MTHPNTRLREKHRIAIEEGSHIILQPLGANMPKDPIIAVLNIGDRKPRRKQKHEVVKVKLRLLSKLAESRADDITSINGLGTSLRKAAPPIGLFNNAHSNSVRNLRRRGRKALGRGLRSSALSAIVISKHLIQLLKRDRLMVGAAPIRDTEANNTGTSVPRGKGTSKLKIALIKVLPEPIDVPIPIKRSAQVVTRRRNLSNALGPPQDDLVTPLQLGEAQRKMKQRRRPLGRKTGTDGAPPLPRTGKPGARVTYQAQLLKPKQESVCENIALHAQPNREMMLRNKLTPA